jgi:glycosyltransferase involved in cell wall biosynthesis
MDAGSSTPQYSIIVATLNEQDSIAGCIERILAIYPRECEVVVVNGGDDRTGAIVGAIARDNPAVRYTDNRGDRGKGHAIRVGVSLARAPIHAQIDADLQFLPEELPHVIDPIRRGEADIVLGSRFTRGSRRGSGSTPALRTFGNKAISAYASLLFGHRMTDVQAGMKAWSAHAIRRVDLRSDNYSYEVEIAAKGLKHGLRVIDVPVTTECRRTGHSNVRLMTAGLALLRDIALFRLDLK